MNTPHQIDILPNGNHAWKYHCHTCGKVVGYAGKTGTAFRVNGEGAFGKMFYLGTSPTLITAERLIQDNHIN